MAKTYTTRSGDTWDMIALRQSGAERYMDRWIEANPAHNYVARFSDGMVLTDPGLPELERPASLPPWLRP